MSCQITPSSKTLPARRTGKVLWRLVTGCLGGALHLGVLIAGNVGVLHHGHVVGLLRIRAHLGQWRLRGIREGVITRVRGTDFGFHLGRGGELGREEVELGVDYGRGSPIENSRDVHPPAWRRWSRLPQRLDPATRVVKERNGG